MRHWNACTFSLIASLALFSPFAVAGGDPPRGEELYRLLRQGGLVKDARAPAVTWLPDGSAYVVADRAAGSGAPGPVIVDPATGRQEPFPERERIEAAYRALAGQEDARLSWRRLAFSPDGGKLSFGAFSEGLCIYDRERGEMQRFPPFEHDGPRPRLSPDWTRAAFVREYDLFVKDIRTGAEVPVTRGGSEEVRNARPDWVYPEELDQRDAFWWSPDGTKIAFFRFDERPVTRFPLVRQAAPLPVLEFERYPKAGGPNPIVTLHIADLSAGTITDADMGADADVYIVRGEWLPDGSAITFQRLNRLQNRLDLLAADPATGSVRLLLSEEEECFVNLSFDLTFLAGGREFLWTSERSGFRQIYLYDLEAGLKRQLTREEFPAGRIAAVDEQAGCVFFTAAVNRGLDTRLFRAGLDGGGQGCTCLTPEPGTHAVDLAPNGRWFFDTFSSLEAPPQAVLRRGDGALVRRISTADTTALDALGLEAPELLCFKAADGSTDLNGLLFKPAGFDAAKRYPLLVHVYGGPHGQIVRSQFASDGKSQADAQLGYIVFQMDNRGTPNRGKAFETATYLRLGQVDLADQVAGVRHVCARPYVDASRVGITGGSYGGYMTCMALLAAPDVFCAGVACSSVTDWRNYDTIYTERYMRRPQDNPEGYDKGSTLAHAANLNGKLLLVHGAIDDNVHLANTLQLVDKLVEADRRFDLMIYPDQRHGIWGAAGEHLADLAREYFAEHLRPEEARLPK